MRAIPPKVSTLCRLGTANGTIKLFGSEGKIGGDPLTTHALNFATIIIELSGTNFFLSQPYIYIIL